MPRPYYKAQEEFEMKKIGSQLLLLGALVTPVFAGNVTFITNPGTAVDSVNWSSIGGDGTQFSDGATVNSTLSNQATIGLGTSPSLGGITSVVCDSTASSPCSWGHQTSGYNDGDTLIWLEGLDSNESPVGTGPLTLSLLNGVGGLGAYLQATGAGSYIASLALYNNQTLLGSQSFSSNDNGDPLFVGAVDDTAGDITSAVLSLTSCGTGSITTGCDVNDFTVNTLQIYSASGSTTPEPSTFALGGTLLAFGMALKSRVAKGNK